MIGYWVSDEALSFVGYPAKVGPANRRLNFGRRLSPTLTGGYLHTWNQHIQYDGEGAEVIHAGDVSGSRRDV